MKWCLNRPTQAKNSSFLRTLAGLASKTGIYKPLGPSQILKTEKMVTNAIDVTTNEYINIISLSCHEQVCLSGLRFERYFSHHRAR